VGVQKVKKKTQRNKKERERCRFRLDEEVGCARRCTHLCTFERITDDWRQTERERERASDFGIVGYFLPSLQGGGVGVK
jgi:hypothetical protein